MLKQSLSQKLMQRLSPQQIQLMKLLQVPTIDIEQRIKDEIEVNPALEEESEDKMMDDDEMIFMKDTEKQLVESDAGKESGADSDTAMDSETSEDFGEDDFGDNLDLNDYINEEQSHDYDYSSSDHNMEEKKSVPVAVQLSFHEILEEQLHTINLSDKELLIGTQIIGSLDDDGYLRRSLDAIADDIMLSTNIECTTDEIENVLTEIQGFEPAGIGARDLRECLLLQLDRAKHDTKGYKYASMIIDEYFEQFTKKHYEKIQKSLSITDIELKSAIDLLLTLNPKPGGTVHNHNSKEAYIIPDFYLIEDDNGQLEIGLNSRNAPELKISESYREMFVSYNKAAKKDPKQKEAVLFIKQKIDNAKWFIDAIKQRQHTLILTMESIFHHQLEFFKTGDDTKLKPMILKDIADKTNLDISTISRVANSKYIQTEYGIFPLKFFFSESLTTDSGEEVSTREVKKIMKDMIEAETKGKPLSDQKITQLLQQKGYNIARRTVAKYREQLDIPVARLRKEL